MSNLRDLLDKYRNAAQTEREKGTYFEELIIDYLKNDPVQASIYDAVWTFKDWADAHEVNANDTGVDLVARIREDETFCAIQCKFYDENKTIQKGDIDKFFAASSKSHFTRRLFVDTTRNEWGKNALDTLNGQNIETNRIGLETLEQSPIDWNVYAQDRKIKLAEKKQLREHQKIALAKVEEGLKTADRGKLIMACGTGKTYTSLKIAEKIAGPGKTVLYLVPSLALMSQTVREWSLDTETPLRSFAACSDAQVGKRKASDDIAEINIHDLEYPATTDAKKLAQRVPAPFNDEDMTVVFSTYQSIQVISDAQNKYGLGAFDLVICDEAHRTTGATLANEDESHFVKVHSDTYIKAKKRLYMTATPRIFGDAVKTKANEVNAEIASMDDPAMFGETLHTISFSEAVQRELLTDYKVIVLAVDQEVISAGVQKRLSDENSQLVLDDATKIIGCYRALSKHGIKNDLIADTAPMRRAVAFCQSIKASKLIKDEFSAVVDEYLEDQGEDADNMLRVETDHVDGTYNAKERHALLEWLNNHDDPNVCRILSNARCLSEGVDVPALDAILFLHPRKSQIDVVQSVGRVMRRAPGKKLGYVILPVGIPAGMSADEALNDNKNYKVVWDVLNALRAHDDRFDATINKAELGVDVSSKIEIIAEAKTLPEKNKAESAGASNIGAGGDTDDKDPDSLGDGTPSISEPVQGNLFIDEFSKAIMARIVKKCGTRNYWTDWASDIAKVAQTHITRIKAVVEVEGSKEKAAFDGFLDEIRDDLNNSITQDDAIEMLAQHIITKPVFDALFEGYSFTKHNPVSKALQHVLDVLDEQNLEKESESLKKFYADVRRKVGDIGDNLHAKQQIVANLYEKFFKTAFKKTTDKFGIVYTPVEVVDFIIHSINDILQKEFGQTLGSKGVHIIDPFTGTGTFITRLLQSGLIKPDELEHKFKHEIHANEIVLLAYYIAAINIEQVYHGLKGGDYEPFNGICLTDTFQLYEKDDLVSNLLEDNSARRNRQKELDIRVIMGNPPYSAGQTSANDNNANVAYPSLDESIRTTYAAHTKATNVNALYDSYIRAIRWGSDRLAAQGGAGVMGFVSNAGWIEGNSMSGLRKCLREEYASLYIFHLRGNQRTSGELSRKEGGKIFGSGSRAPIAITLFVKNPDAQEHGKIYFHDIGDYLSQDQKLKIVKGFRSVTGIDQANGWQPITPDKYNDWLNQRDDSFDEFMVMGDKKDKSATTIFANYSSGVKTQRDVWCYNSSPSALRQNIQQTIEFYNTERERFVESGKSKAEDVINTDSTKISWSTALKNDLERNRSLNIDEGTNVISVYRPFTKLHLHYGKRLNERRYQMPQIFPTGQENNLVIMFNSNWSGNGNLVLMSNTLPDLHANGDAQCFPLKLYEKVDNESDGLFAGQAENGYRVKDGITDEARAHFRAAYPGEEISKEDLFYYIYGLLHSEDYRTRYADNLSKQLPRIPAVKKASDFWAFSQAGRKLADVHVNYETVEPYQVGFKEGALLHANFTDADYRVEKMKFGKKGKEKDKTTVIYNHKITMTDIPLEAYDYIVNAKPALEWVMERQCVKTDKASGIVNDANDYALETVGDASYPLKLFQRIITVSLETMKIVKALPRLDIEVKGEK